MMKLQKMLLLGMISLHLVSFVSASVGTRIDDLVARADTVREKTQKKCERALLELRFFTGNIPPLTVENLKEHPEHKDAYISYALAHYKTLDVSITTAVWRQYPTEFTQQAATLALKL